VICRIRQSIPVSILPLKIKESQGSKIATRVMIQKVLGYTGFVSFQLNQVEVGASKVDQNAFSVSKNSVTFSLW